MKILAIMGSPKGKGNGYGVAQQVESEMKNLQDVDFEYLFLKNANIEPCQGCFLCVTKGESRCPITDDFNNIVEKIEKADGIILVSPVYVYNVSWLMKVFIDRFSYTNHRPRFFDKKLMVIANAGSGMEETIEVLKRTFGDGPEVVAEIAYLSPPWQLAEKVEKKQAETLRKAAVDFMTALKKESKSVPGLNKYIRYRFFKHVSQTAKEYLPADFEYYRTKGEYYYDTKISPVKKIIAWFMLKIGMFFMKDMAPRQG